MVFCISTMMSANAAEVRADTLIQNTTNLSMDVSYYGNIPNVSKSSNYLENDTNNTFQNKTKKKNPAYRNATQIVEKLKEKFDVNVKVKEVSIDSIEGAKADLKKGGIVQLTDSNGNYLYLIYNSLFKDKQKKNSLSNYILD